MLHLINNDLSKRKQFSKISRKKANNMRIKMFLKNNNRKKYKYSNILNYV